MKSEPSFTSEWRSQKGPQVKEKMRVHGTTAIQQATEQVTIVGGNNQVASGWIHQKRPP